MIRQKHRVTYTNPVNEQMLRSLSSLKIERGYYLVPTLVKLESTTMNWVGYQVSASPVGQDSTFFEFTPYTTMSAVVDLMLTHNVSLSMLKAGTVINTYHSEALVGIKLGRENPAEMMESMLLGERCDLSAILCRPNYSMKNVSVILYALYGEEYRRSRSSLRAFVGGLTSSDFGLRDANHGRELLKLVIDVLGRPELVESDLGPLMTFIETNGRQIVRRKPWGPLLKSFLGYEIPSCLT